MAASQSGRDMDFYTFDEDDCSVLNEIVALLKGRTVGDVYRLLEQLAGEHKAYFDPSMSKKQFASVPFSFLCNTLAS